MSSDPKSYARAAVLAGTISAIPPSASPLALHVPAVRRQVIVHDPPLDVPLFHYRVTTAGEVIALHSHWRRCKHGEGRGSVRSLGRNRRTEARRST